MNTVLFTAAFALGALTIGWIGAGFIEGHLLALAVTALIGIVYLIGCIEMLLFRRATRSLSRALHTIASPVSDLAPWMSRLHVSLQSAVRSRIEGQRTALPGPALTPYLVGLLVMLGMLGTFAGMVVTLNGAVFALESTTDLHAVRAGLSAPIKGLGLAFGTSVAGVAASALLGLISTLSRRERLVATRLLDEKITTVLRGVSLAHQRDETFKALQLQANALPAVIDQLAVMANQMERMGQSLNDKLLANQDRFQNAAQSAFADLARSVEQSLKASLAESGRLAGESLKPVLAETLQGLAQASQHTQSILLNATQSQLDGFAERFHHTAGNIADRWQQALASHEHASETLASRLDHSLQAFNATFEGSQRMLVERIQHTAGQWQQQIAIEEQQRLAIWQDKLASHAETLRNAWQIAGEHTTQQQNALLSQLQAMVSQLVDTQQASARTLLCEMTQLLNSTEAQLRQRMAVDDAFINEARASHQQLSRLAQQHVDTLCERLEQMANQWSASWQQGLAQQQNANTALTDQIHQSLSGFDYFLLQLTQSLLASLQEHLAHAQSTQTLQDQQRLTQWTSALESMAATLTAEWRQASEQAIHQQRTLCTTLEATAARIADHSQTSADQLRHDLTPLLDNAEQLLQARIASENVWLQQQSERMEALTHHLGNALAQLRDDEAARGHAALERLSALQTEVAAHLSNLGTALEAPMSRLIETASEAPRAAAEVIAQLRTEIANTSARDNDMLTERQRLMEQLQSLMTGLNQSATEQRNAVDTLVKHSAELLHNAGHELIQQVNTEAGKLTDIAAQITGSAVEVSSLSEAFGFAVQRYAETNDKLIDNLHRIESALDKSNSRSDEQLAYYVAQAREIIDLSTLSQKEIFDELRQLKTRAQHEEAEVG